MIVAIDGPTAAGKGTLARLLARDLGFAYLDTGSLYRAVGLALLRTGHSPDDEAAAVAAARSLGSDLLTDPGLRDEATGNAASRVAAMPAVRAALLDYQREFARRPPGGARGAVLDGRDIGTVVCPDATVKLFVTAAPEVRARRRHLELSGRGEDVPFAQVLADLNERDRRDQARAAAPLRPAPDAHLLDTSDLAIDAALARAKAIIAGRM
ncbi:MAG: (d)CMP kinase [Alphaproteobacteria bacterium]|nr:(d)CMP kinase [Alphaproteobacteria bacterium]